jgi:hypothetical protein
MGAYWTVLCIISYLVGMYLGSKLNTDNKVKGEKIKIKNQKVLVIKPIKHTTAEEQKQIEQIQPKNGKVILPQWCEYQFGEISNVILEERGLK